MAVFFYIFNGCLYGRLNIISDILFENIRVEDAPNSQLFDFRIKPSAWNKDPKPGRIHSVKYKDIYLNGKPGIDRLPEDSRLEGFNSESTIEDITFENINILGKRVMSIEDCNLNCNEFTKNIRFVDSDAGEVDDACIPVESKASNQ